MQEIVSAQDLSARDRRMLFWASFLSLLAAGFGFSFRVAMGGDYRVEFGLSNQQVGEVFGASLWPIAITMVGFSLVVDRIGYKIPMYIAFALQVVSGVGTFFADSYMALYGFALCAGLGHGIVEAVINPICAAVYPKAKTKWLTYLHAAWPAGLVLGTLMIIGAESLFDGWRVHALWIVLPALAYAVMYGPCRFPVDERVQAGVPYIEMLRQVGFLGAALSAFMMVYEIGNQVDHLTEWKRPENWFTLSLIAGGAIGAVFGLWTRALGKPLFFLLCLLMIPVATAELGTDGWIKKLMTPVLENLKVNPAFALVFSAFIMLVFRVFAGGILRIMSPPVLLCVSGVFSAIGLYWLAGASGVAILVAFVLYALGQTYYWPCVLGFVSERFPEGGALTLNTVSAIGLLSAGIIATPVLGVAFDRSIRAAVATEAPPLAEAATADASFLWMQHQKIDPGAAEAFIEDLDEPDRAETQSVYDKCDAKAGRDALRFAACFPAVLVVVFGMIALYFRSGGGYRPVELRIRQEPGIPPKPDSNQQTEETQR
ncbi:MAG: hypothetical protein CMJ18_25965 [Phycisphaeraceae bacterium]|nr:hypothetical protein [Phycisphaeraceae bacterium]